MNYEDCDKKELEEENKKLREHLQRIIDKAKDKEHLSFSMYCLILDAENSLNW